MAATSIHFQAVKGGSEEHNKREKELDYTFKERAADNEYWQSDTQTDRLKAIKEAVKTKTGKKLRKNAAPIQEAVVVIDERTTMADLRRLGDRLKERFGIEVFQIAIHRDEGYKHSDGTKLNLHAHLVADWYNHETGKSARPTRQDCRDMQTIAAEVLGMDRGVSSDKRHLDAVQYKIHAEEQYRQELEKTLNELSAAKTIKEEAKETLLRLFGASKRDKAIKSLSEQLDALRAKFKALQGNFKTLKENATKVAQESVNKDKAIKQLKNEVQEAKKDRSALLKEIDKLNRALYPDRYANTDMVDGRQVSDVRIAKNRDGSFFIVANVDGRRVDAAIGNNDGYNAMTKMQKHTLEGEERRQLIQQFILPQYEIDKKQDLGRSRGFHR